MKKILPLVLFVLILSASFFSGKIYAAEPQPVPPPGKIPCSDPGKNPEFDSLRPYQASPCGDANIANFCGNQINIVETKTGRHSGWVDSMQVDWWNGGSPSGKDYWIDLSGTEFPIAGNTQLVQNSQNNEEKLDDSTKVNEYVSWYLSGVNNKAEYGDTKNTADSLINFSGPIQKLLPQAIQEAQRVKTIESASKTVTSTNEDQISPDKGSTSQGQTSDTANHNQIVVCASRAILGLIGKVVPHECYAGNGSSAIGKEYRLKEWVGSLSILRTLSNSARDILSKVPGIGNIVSTITTDAWNNRKPPLPWADANGVPFRSDLEYQKAYYEWRGKSCGIIPVINKLICFDNPFVTNEWADLFPYVPLANNSDKGGKMPINTVLIQPGGGTEIDTKTWTRLAAPLLFYPHTEESKQLSVLLNSSYIPKGVDATSIPADTTESNTYDSPNPKCRIVNVRSNPGDDLFPIKKPADIGVNVVFHVTTIDNCEHLINEKTGAKYSICHGLVSIGIQTDPVRVPNAEEIWKSTVAGNASTFRKMYPKVEAGAPVSCIADIPSVSNATYTIVAGTDKIGVEGPLGSPDKTNMDPANAQIYFPHWGSVYDYFLKGIQTALRPKGFGDPSPQSGTECKTNSQNLGDICAVASAYHIPCCQLKGIAQLETEGGKSTGGGSCNTKNGSFSCCNGSVCGPSQIACGQYDAFAGSDKIDMCDPVGSAELLARAMLLKLCQAGGLCDSYDWNKWGKTVMAKYKVPEGDYTAAAYFYGLNNGCTQDACTQYRWGAGKTYCDTVKSYCETGKTLPDNTSPQFCSACSAELVGAGQSPLNCSNP